MPILIGEPTSNNAANSNELNMLFTFDIVQ